ncbi:MAG: YhdH/YhfP family quinone oxidoreductase [Deltaproteobacteria bacterium]|nr:YhdH/YhfP family quinone oxidoreductase [Deltaproteobacteria bacterium]
MAQKTFKALVITETPEKRYLREVKEKSLSDLPPGDVLVKVAYSSLNYKDALSAIGNKGVTKQYPHTPGIDAAGVVEESQSPEFKPGDEVIVTSYDLGMNTPGGFGQYIRVPAGWVVKRPDGLTLRESMIYGTAGFTAALSVFRLLGAGVTADQGKILVSGATGGVGSVAVAILAKEGFAVTAVSGRPENKDYLLGIGAREMISAEEATDTSGKPLLKSLWAGSVDTVGGPILATTIKSTNYGGVVTCCGNAASPDLPLNVFPFILRGVTLIGIDSQNCPMEMRRKVWHRIAGDWKLPHLEKLASETDLAGLSEQIDLMLKRQHRGRTIVRLPD